MFKLGKMNSKSIVNGILVCGLIYIALALLTILSQFILVSATPVTSPRVVFSDIMYLINTWTKPILGLCLLKFVCEFLYKILRLTEILTDKNVKLSDE